MTPNASKIYRQLRANGEKAQRSIDLARDYDNAKHIGITFHWDLEQESPIDVFGEPTYCECLNCEARFYRKGDCPDCDNPRVVVNDTGVYFDPNAEHYCLTARYKDPESGESHLLASLGMIDTPFEPRDTRGYWFTCETEMSREALAELDRIIGSRDETNTEETLG